jgi:hypothetical protein
MSESSTRGPQPDKHDSPQATAIDEAAAKPGTNWIIFGIAILVLGLLGILVEATASGPVARVQAACNSDAGQLTQAASEHGFFTCGIVDNLPGVLAALLIGGLVCIVVGLLRKLIC